MDKKIILKIKELRNGGLSYGEISKLMEVTKSQARYYYLFDIDKHEIKEEENKVFEKEVCENALKASSFYELCKKVDRWPCKENIITLKKILDKHKIDYSNFINANKSHKYTTPKRAISEYLKKDCEYRISTNHLKIRLLKEKIKEYRCEKCGNTEWNGKEIPLQLHHINGDSNDNRLENLQILCPNCHAQTDNFSRPKVIKEKNKCIVCGAEISNKAKYCRECYHKTEDGKRYRQDKLLKVSKEELIEEYKKCGSFKILGKKYGVSDRTISKWFGKYDLPTKAVELRKYIIDKFGHIKWENFSKNTIYLRKFQQDNFKKIALISEDKEIEKIYNSPQELMRDGYIPKNVYRVCKGTLKTHHKRMFKYI